MLGVTMAGAEVQAGLQGWPGLARDARVRLCCEPALGSGRGRAVLVFDKIAIAANTAKQRGWQLGRLLVVRLCDS
jgi:hypothetical protein